VTAGVLAEECEQLLAERGSRA